MGLNKEWGKRRQMPAKVQIEVHHSMLCEGEAHYLYLMELGVTYSIYFVMSHKMWRWD